MATADLTEPSSSPAAPTTTPKTKKMPASHTVDPAEIPLPMSPPVTSASPPPTPSGGSGSRTPLRVKTPPARSKSPLSGGIPLAEIEGLHHTDNAPVYAVAAEDPPLTLAGVASVDPVHDDDDDTDIDDDAVAQRNAAVAASRSATPPAPPVRKKHSAGVRVAVHIKLVAKLLALLDDDSDPAEIRRVRLHRTLAGVGHVWREAAHLRAATVMVVAVPHPQVLSDVVTRAEALAEALAELRAESPTVAAMPWNTLIYASSLRHLELHDVRLGDVELRILARTVRGLTHLALHQCLIGSAAEFANWLRPSRNTLRTLCIVSSRPPVLLEDAALARWSQSLASLHSLTLIFPYATGLDDLPPAVAAAQANTRWGIGAADARGPASALFGGPGNGGLSGTHTAPPSMIGGTAAGGSSFLGVSLPAAFSSSSRPSVAVSVMVPMSSAGGRFSSATILTPAGLQTLAANCPRLRHLAIDVPAARGLALDDVVATLYLIRELRFLALGGTPVRVPANDDGLPAEIHLVETLGLLFPLVRLAAVDPAVLVEIPKLPPLGARKASSVAPNRGGSVSSASFEPEPVAQEKPRSWSPRSSVQWTSWFRRS
ncbi:hypothetical protein H9P43_001676 [Blastocladiella emersonii ATCC 22665]|nr:hypothetical protein H9P43_001676 [Blastocladiella emersonii ATCC 22665]